MAVTLSHWKHSCVRFDAGERALVVDPGVFTDLDRALAGVQAVLVTHEHPDHVQLGPVAARTHDGVEVWAPQPVVDQLVAAGADAGRVHPVAAGDRVVAAGFDVQVVGEWHAVVHPDLPRARNVGYLVDGVYHPGDDVTPPDVPVDVLLVPVSGPWLRFADAIDLVRALRPARVVPIHDAHASEAGLALTRTLLTNLGGAGEPTVLGEGEHLVLDPGVPELEFDENVPPRPEEEVADVARSVPDPAGHGGSVPDERP